ncbi:MAG: four-carbon acid sugar kinase family protein [Bryobacterales bacterium]|nr:four-carbon acid sugar kinase family protein [Bryobacterales bacterium]
MSALDLAFYGDDFTGSTDALDVLAKAGVETVLFLRQPDAAEWARLATGCRAVGLAGGSRSQTPAWMDAHLPGVFQWMRSLNARLCHYKVCSTFDSSPDVGSIGRAIEIARREFAARQVPVIVGAPALRRYVVFGNLFATVAGETHRIDRHPVMSRHPVTPMNEGDLRLHLARQTSLRIAGFDMHALAAPDAVERLAALAADVVVFDTFDEASLRQAGALLTACGAPFVAGSSGVEYALTPEFQPQVAAEEVDRLVVMSGSCSAVTAAQIAWAAANGFAMIPLDPAAPDRERTIAAAVEASSAGRSVVIYSSAAVADRVALDEAGRHALAAASGEILREVLERTGIRRAVIAGGDTSSHAAPALGLHALRFRAALAPGAPLCTGLPSGLEVVFKGGQVGGEAFFEHVRRGRVF